MVASNSLVQIDPGVKQRPLWRLVSSHHRQELPRFEIIRGHYNNEYLYLHEKYLIWATARIDPTPETTAPVNGLKGSMTSGVNRQKVMYERGAQGGG
jgi:hypothetical protein